MMSTGRDKCHQPGTVAGAPMKDKDSMSGMNMEHRTKDGNLILSMQTLNKRNFNKDNRALVED